jgi:hypothetical protein
VISVDIVIHHRVGAEVLLATVKGVERREAEKFVKDWGRLYADSGVVTISSQGGIEAAIPARNVEMMTIKGAAWS